MTPEQMRRQISVAISAHSLWKGRLRIGTACGFMEQSSKETSRDCLCGFGKWLKSVEHDPQISKSDYYRKVRDLHTSFHSHAGNIVKFIEAGQKEEAARQLENPAYQSLVDELSATLVAWKRSV